MKFIIFSLFFCIFQVFVWADMPLNKKTAVVHIEHPDHVPHHPRGQDPTEKASHDGIIYPRKKIKK